MKIWLTLIVLLATNLLAAEKLSIDSTIYYNNNVIGKPILETAPGKNVSLSVSDSYDLKLTLTQEEENKVTVAAKITVSGETFNPKVTTELGQVARIDVDSMGFEFIVTQADESNSK